MNISAFLKVFLLILISSYGNFGIASGRGGLEVTEVLDLDSLGHEFYNNWRSTQDTSKLLSADSCYTLFFNSIPKNSRYEYAYKIAKEFTINKESAWLLKSWYLKAINGFDQRNSKFNSGLTSYQVLEEKYALVLEFTYLYSRNYGYCEDAVEVLREYKTEYSFKYIQYKRGLDKTDKIWLKLVKEDQYLSWECVERR